MAPRFANIKFNLLLAIELFGDMNNEDMDVQAPPSSESHFKEYQLASRLNTLLDQLIEEGFFDDCDLRADDVSSEDEYDDEDDDDDDDNEDGGPSSNDDNDDDDEEQEESDSGRRSNSQRGLDYAYNSDSRSTPRSSGFSYDRHSHHSASSSSRQNPPASSRSHSGGSRESFSRRFKRWFGSGSKR